MKNILLSATLLVVANSPALAYELTDLGPNVQPKAINNTGVVVGSSNTDLSPATAFQWTSTYGFELIDGTSANAVNDNGQITGSTITGAFILDANNYRYWSDYGAFGINQSGAVAGYKVGKNPYQPRSLPYNPAIFNGNKWDVSDIAGIYPRGTSEGVYADRFILNSINADGYTVGYKYRYGLAATSAILLDPNVTINDSTDVTYLPIPAGGRAADINNNNMIVGATGSSSSTVPVTYSQAYILDYNISDVTMLPVLQGGLRSNAYDINENNQVVGSSETLIGSTTVNHAFVWNKADGVIIDLNDGAPDGWVLTSATAINDNGDIVGNGLLNGVAHGFILTNGATGVIPEPLSAQNQAPVAMASADNYSGKAALVVSLDSSASADSDGTIAAYFWDFMDGSFSTEANPVHEFTVPGTYPVTLTVTDDQGMQASSSINITVRKGKRK
jgi:probable HAF family extracellular repeat protein